MTTPGDDVRARWKRANAIVDCNETLGDYRDPLCLAPHMVDRDGEWWHTSIASMQLDGFTTEEVTRAENE